MNESRPNGAVPPAAWPGLAIAASLAVGLSAFAFFPARWDALNYFDPPKRVIWALLALFLAMTWRPSSCRVLQRLAWSTLGLALWMVGRTWFRPRPLAELETLCVWLLPVLLFGLSLGSNRARVMKQIGQVLVVAGLVQAGWMVLQRLGWDPMFGAITTELAYKPGRMVGTIGYQNQAVDFLALTVAGAFWAFESAKLRGMYAALIFLVVGLAGSRGGILAFVAAGLVALPLAVEWRKPRTRKQWLNWVAVAGGAGLAMAAWLWGVPETAGRFREAITEMRDSPAVGSRVWMARVAGTLLAERPWTGWGAGEFALQYLDRLGEVLPDAKTHRTLQSVVFAREAHNDHLQFAVEFGLIGWLGLAALAGGMALRTWRIRRVSPALAAGLAFVGVYMAVAALFSFPWQTSMAGPLAALLLGLGCASASEPLSAPSSPAGSLAPRRVAAGKAVWSAAACALLAWFLCDAWLVCAVPPRLARGDVAAAKKGIPPWGHRYRALVGAAYAAQEAWPEAERELRAALAGYVDAILWNNLAHVYARQGKWAEATELYRRWVASGVNHADALWNWSVASEQAGQIPVAAEALEDYARLFPRLGVDQIMRLAVLQYQAGEVEKAGNALARYVRIWSAAPPATVAKFENLSGAIALAQGNSGQARDRFRHALELDPGLESARRNMEGLDAPSPER